MTLAVAVLLASLLGSVHCAAMCGAFVCFYSSGPAGSRATNLRGHAAYNLGRLVSYLLLGTIAGGLGTLLNRAGLLAGIGESAGIVAGVLMIGWGINSMLIARGARSGVARAPASWQHAMGSVLQRVREQPAVIRAGVTGLVTTLLPCGWLYAFVVVAGGRGTPLGGALVMLIFWTGTLPMMVTVGLGARTFFGPLRSRMPTISAAVVVLLGLLSIANHFGWLPGMHWMHQLTVAVPRATADATLHHLH